MEIRLVFGFCCIGDFLMLLVRSLGEWVSSWISSCGWPSCPVQLRLVRYSLYVRLVSIHSITKLCRSKTIMMERLQYLVATFDSMYIHRWYVLHINTQYSTCSVHHLCTCMFGYVAHHMSNGSFCLILIIIILLVQHFLKAFRRMLCRFWNPCLTMVSMEMPLGTVA